MTYEYYPQSRSTDLVIQTVGNETLVYDLRSKQAHCLNETAAFVWSKCNGELSVEDIASFLAGATASSLAQIAILQLSERNHLKEPVPRPSCGWDRREMLKKIGAISVIAVPMIASIVAPPQALGSLSCLCASNAECGVCGTTHCNTVGVCAPDPRPSSVSIKQSV